jgi:hypothetical protein
MVRSWAKTMRSGYKTEEYQGIWGNSYYDDELKALNTRKLVPRVFVRKSALIALHPSSGCSRRAEQAVGIREGYKRIVLKEVVERVVLSGNAIVIDRREAEPIVGELVPRKGIRSGAWRFIDVEWDG